MDRSDFLENTCPLDATVLVVKLSVYVLLLSSEEINQEPITIKTYHVTQSFVNISNF